MKPAMFFRLLALDNRASWRLGGPQGGWIETTDGLSPLQYVGQRWFGLEAKTGLHAGKLLGIAPKDGLRELWRAEMQEKDHWTWPDGFWPWVREVYFRYQMLRITGLVKGRRKWLTDLAPIAGRNFRVWAKWKARRMAAML